MRSFEFLTFVPLSFDPTFVFMMNVGFFVFVKTSIMRPVVGEYSGDQGFSLPNPVSFSPVLGVLRAKSARFASRERSISCNMSM